MKGHEATAAAPALSVVPVIRLAAERVLVREEADLLGNYDEREVAVIELAFDYGGTRIGASDAGEQFFVSHEGALRAVRRDAAGEERARRILEGFGAVELACLPTHALAPDSRADYLVHLEGDLPTWCSFAAYAVPQLRSLGFSVEFSPGYPWRVLDHEPLWYSHVEPGDRADWFSLELGVELDGRRVNLLPALLELLDASRGASSLEALRATPLRPGALRVDAERCLIVPSERLARVLEVLIELYRGERRSGDRLRFQGWEAASLVKLEDAASEGQRLRRTGSGGVRERGHALAAVALEAPRDRVEGLQANLRPYQRDGLAWLERLRALGTGGILADDMGLGKTLQVIALLAAEKSAGRMTRPSLVVMPTSLIGNWQRELRRFAPTLEVTTVHGPGRRASITRALTSDVVLTTYPLLLRDLAHYEDKLFHYLILDEAQAIKNRTSLVSRAVRSIGASHRLCLTGTPIENGLGELWSLFDFVLPGFLGSAAEFQARYHRPGDGDDMAADLAALRRRVAPFILRRMKEQVARELPPKTELVQPIELTGRQRELYEGIRVAAHADVRRAIQKMGLSRATIPILDALMKLRQVCCDPRLLTVDAARAVRASAKYDRFFELLADQLDRSRRVLVFSQFARMLALLSSGLSERGVAHVSLTGTTSNRQDPIDRFCEGKADVFLISLKAGGTGLNLTSADTVIHYDPWWNPAAQAQATDRAYRIGQTRPVFVHHLIVAGSVEERMLALQRGKQNLADAILGAGGGDARLSSDVVDRLFSPLGTVV